MQIIRKRCEFYIQGYNERGNACGPSQCMNTFSSARNTFFDFFMEEREAERRLMLEEWQTNNSKGRVCVRKRKGKHSEFYLMA